MASLENKKIKDTYEGLLKTDDNAAIDGAVEITDGAGNGTGVTISNDGQVTATGTVSFGSLKDTGEDITVTKFVDEADGIGNNDNDTSVPTSAAVKDYVDTNVTAQDLDFQGDSGTGAVDLDSQSLDIAGGTGIDTSAVDQTLTVNIDSTVATLTGTQTLTNKTVDADSNTVSNLEVDNLKSGVLDTDLTSVSASDDTLASAKAIKTYVDSNITAQDLDITDGTTTSAVDLDSQTLTIEGTANEVEVSLTDQTFTVGLPTSITTNVTGNLTGNVTGDLTGNADTASALETARTISLSGDVAGSVSFDGSANADITATIQANSVALGTDTTGDYVENLGTGTGVTIGSNTGEGSSPTISVDYGSTANTAVQGDTSLTIQGTANEIEVTGGGVTLGSGGTVTVGLPDDVSLGGSLTIAQNLTVNGTTTTVNTDTLSVEDPLIELARDNSENSVDVGLYGKYSLDSGVTTKYSGLFKDASDSDKFKLFKGLEVEPTSTVDTSGTGYTKGDLVINDLDAVTISGTISTAAQTNITSVGTLSSLSVSGDLTVDTNTLYVDSSNNRVGLGTSSPTETLDVRGSVKIGKSGTSPYLTFDEEPDSGSGSEFYLTHDISGNILKFTDDNSNNLIAMDRDTGYVGIGTTSPSHNLTINSATGGQLQFQTNGIAKIRMEADSGGGSFYAPSGAYIRHFTSGVERMRIDSSGNLGLGNSSPTTDSLAGNGGLVIGNGSGNKGITIYGSTTSQQNIAFTDTSSSQQGLIQYDHSGDYMRLFTSSSERLRITSDGKLGLGTSSPDHKLHLEESDTTSVFLKTENTAGALLVGNNSSGNSFVSSQTSGKDLLFETANTERMRLDSNGNLGLGTSSVTNSRLQIKGANNTTNAYSDGLKVTSNNETVFTQYNWNGINGDTGLSFATGGTERFSIDSSGNVSIRDGKTLNILNSVNSAGGSVVCPGGGSLALRAYGNNMIVLNEDSFIQFAVGSGSEKARIDGNGHFLIGVTSITDTSSRTYGNAFSGSSSYGNWTSWGSGAHTHATFRNGTNAVGSITTSSTATAYNTSSDYRLKENVVDLTGALDRVDQLEPKRFNFIADEDTTVDGFLAHEVQDIVPEAVTGDKDATEEYEVSPEVLDDEGNVVEEAVMGTRDVYQGIDQSKLVPLLVGAIKELRAEVNSLKAQINN